MFSEYNIVEALKMTLKNDGQKYVHLIDPIKNGYNLYNSCSSSEGAAFIVFTVNK